jgi:hypothetical protein
MQNMNITTIVAVVVIIINIIIIISGSSIVSIITIICQVYVFGPVPIINLEELILPFIDIQKLPENSTGWYS